MTHDRAATLVERAAFMLALFARNQMFHGSYVVEKLEVAFAEGIKPATLEALLDSWNRKRYRLALDRRAWQRLIAFAAMTRASGRPAAIVVRDAGSLPARRLA